MPAHSVTTTAAAAGTRRHTGTYPAEPRQVGLARAALAGWLGGCPQADEAILVASEFATNSVAFFLLCFGVAIAAIGGWPSGNERYVFALAFLAVLNRSCSPSTCC